MEKALRAHHSDRNLDTISTHKPSCVNTATVRDRETRRGGRDGLTYTLPVCDLDNVEFKGSCQYLSLQQSLTGWSC